MLHGSARVYAAKVTKEIIYRLEWEVLLHPEYSADLNLSEYHLFTSMCS